MRLAINFRLPYSVIAASVPAFTAALQNELAAVTQLPAAAIRVTSVTGSTGSTRSSGGGIVAGADAWFDAGLQRTYADATTFAMGVQVSPGLLTRAGFAAQYASPYSCTVELHPRFIGECSRLAHLQSPRLKRTCRLYQGQLNMRGVAPC